MFIFLLPLRQPDIFPLSALYNSKVALVYASSHVPFQGLLKKDPLVLSLLARRGIMVENISMSIIKRKCSSGVCLMNF